MKVCGNISSFSLIRNERNRIIVSFSPIKSANHNYFIWNEIIFYKKKKRFISLDDIKNAIISEINTETNNNIIKNHVWNNMPIWLNNENQFNYKASYDLAVQTNGATLPVKFKFGDDNNPIYYQFDNLEELNSFYVSCVNHINSCLAEGWSRKDAINYDEYKVALDKLYE